METRLRLVCLALLLSGCPSPTSPSPTSPSPAPPSPAANPSQSPNPPPPAPSLAPAAPSAKPVPAGSALPPEDIPLGTQAHPWPGVNLGLERVEDLGHLVGGTRREHPAGHLTLALGQLSCSSDVFAGDRLRVGGALLEVLRVERGYLRLRWLTSPAGAAPPKVRPARPRMRELGLYRFQDGQVLGVGKVTTLAKRDGSAVDVVTLSLFPPNYDQNPLQDYEVLPRLVSGQSLGSKPLGGRVLRLAELRPAGDEPGWIRLAE